MDDKKTRKGTVSQTGWWKQQSIGQRKARESVAEVSEDLSVAGGSDEETESTLTRMLSQ